MTKLKITSFKRGFIWYAACEIPNTEEFGCTYYYDNTPTVILRANVVLSTIALSNYKVNKKMIKKLRKYFKGKGEGNG